MTISYSWLSEYLPESIEPEKLSKILTSIGLEVESLTYYEKIKGNLEGLVVGEVISCEKHPNADKLKVTQVNVGNTSYLQIVCGAANVAAGQKVLVATVGTTIYPANAEPLTMRIAKIRGIESFGMICAEDEVGLGKSHDGIMVLPTDLIPGTPANQYFEPYNDWIYEIGLTPNRMDAMSHWGVAKDVCAYLSFHQRSEVRAKLPSVNQIKPDTTNSAFEVIINNSADCARYCGVSISGVTVSNSPQWLQNRLLAIGQKPINNIVDITNYILHETGQPLHAFDASAITGNKVVVSTLPEGTKFTTLDEKERTLTGTELMICNGSNEPMCIAGVFGGLHSGVNAATTQIFLESACFSATSVRATSLKHGLRTEAATRFEKGVDIAQTLMVLKRAAAMIKDIAGGEISSDWVDVYPHPQPKKQVALKNHYLKKLSGKNYHPDAVKRILFALGFELVKEGLDEIIVAVPYSKPDISLPADIVEEIVRIDGLDNIEIPATITITPATENNLIKENIKNKIAAYLTGQGFFEIVTNSITNSKYYNDDVLNSTVKMMNNLSADLDVLRPSMLETGLEVIAYNNNRKLNSLQLFEIGKTYHSSGVGKYDEKEQIAIYITASNTDDTWNNKQVENDIFKAKGIAEAVAAITGIAITNYVSEYIGNEWFLHAYNQQTKIGSIQMVSATKAKTFDIKQTIYYINLQLNNLLQLATNQKIVYKEVSKFPVVQRDLALILNSNIAYADIRQTVQKLQLSKLQKMRLFDIFESEKLGAGKKSMAINFSFLDEEKTLTDKEIDAMVQQLIQAFETNLQAEIRK